MLTIDPEKVRFIKLGFGGDWEQSAIQENTIRLGYESTHHKDCLAGNWDLVWNFWLDVRSGNKGTATNDIRQIRDFYELKETDVWITFYKRKLYWCRAAKEVIELEDKTRIRNVIGSWSSTDINGKTLGIENLDGRVTKVQMYKGTICSIDLQEYLVRKINGLTIAEVENAKISLLNLKSDVKHLIKGLHWNDFETLVDLIFSKAGWQRFSVLGKTQKDIDLDVYSPATQKRAFIQVKSTTYHLEIESSIDSFIGYEQFDEMYFIFHTCHDNLTDFETNMPNVHIWGLEKVSELVVNAGLVEWLINKRT